MDDLRALSRQHTFAGYSLVTDDGSKLMPYCIRHHALDWNYHPSFPRSRPNKWYIEQHPAKDGSSFKEYGYAPDPDNGQAIYMERWARLGSEVGEGLDQSGGPCLALRRIAGLDADRDALFVVIGDHFALARDRTHPLPSFAEATKGGCANLADLAWSQGDRASLVQLLDLEGSYGRVSDGWLISHSTLPWKRGTRMFAGGDAVPVFEGGKLQAVRFLGAEWEVLECDMDAPAVARMFASNGSKL